MQTFEYVFTSCKHLYRYLSGVAATVAAVADLCKHWVVYIWTCVYRLQTSVPISILGVTVAAVADLCKCGVM